MLSFTADSDGSTEGVETATKVASEVTVKMVVSVEER